MPPTAAWAQGDGGGRGRLVTVAWLQKAQQAENVLVLDASPAQMYAARRIPGAVGADLYTYGIREISNAAMEQRLQFWASARGARWWCMHGEAAAGRRLPVQLATLLQRLLGCRHNAG